MTRSLRQRHRRIWLVLAVLLPVVFLTGLRARRPLSIVSSNPDSLAPRPSPLTSP